MTNKLSRRRLFQTTALAGALALSIAGAAAAQERVYSIPAQPLAASLRDYGIASGEQIIFAETIVKGRQAPPLQGAYDSSDALRMLLADTGLVATRASSGGIMITRADATPQGGSAEGTGAGTVEALIVTAQKREEDIQDVPIAISAFTQETLERSQIAGGPDLMTQVPNMTFTKTNFSSYSIQIRGIGTQAISATTDPAVAVAFNNTPFIRNRFFEQEFYDLQRVEVLRGPQGTLYGRNATAGVVNIISQKPTFGFEAKLSGDVSNYGSSRLEGMVNVPLVEDKVGLRLAGAWTKREGYSTNQITGNPIDGRDLWSTRLQLRFAPTDSIDANLIWEHFKEDDDRIRSGKQLCHRDARTELGGLTYSYGGYGGATPGGLVNQGCLPASLYSPDSFEAPNGFSLPYYHPLGALWVPVVPNFDPYVSTTQSRDLRVIESTVDPHYSAETDIVELQFSYDFSNDLTLTSETGYLSDDLFSTQDYNRFNTAPGAFRPPSFDREGVIDENGFFCDPQIGCANRLVAVDLSTAKSRQFSQEFRIGSDYDGPFNFSLGANFLRYDTEDKYYVFVNTLTLYSTVSLQQQGIVLDPYVNGVSDNTECLGFGLREPDPNQVQSVGGCQYIDPNPIGSLNDMGHNYFLSRNPYKLISYAVFGEAYYNITDNLKLTGGLRWTVDKKEAPRIPSWILAGETVGYPVADVSEQEWREPTGRLTIDWKPDLAFTDETLLYASYAHGYKAGGANPPAAGIVSYANEDSGDALIAQSATHPKTFEAEFVDAFEIGAKNIMLDGRLTLNTNAFYYDYQGYQVSYIVNRSAVNLNFDAQVWGLEIEADWRPLENLKLGFKGGYENTRVADGMRAVDVMDRANGGLSDENGVVWIVTRPFPTFPSNCIVPLYTMDRGSGQLGFGPNTNVNGNVGYCEEAYVLGNDPVTGLPYVPNPTVARDGHNMQLYHPGYIGFDPTTAPNHGEGFYKDLSGKELPNAPHFTATITADYTIPLPSDWLMTLHTDLYYQSEAWTRIFNTEGYDKLKAYTNVNLAAIFTNDEAGWKVMAYVKNIFDRDSITGAFLNSDDSGLTTNVFLTEPRLYGLRVTKEWNGGPWWTGANPNHTGPYPLTVEIGGQVQRQDAPYEPVAPEFEAAFSPAISPIGVQNRDLDWGDGREVKLTYRPGSGSWKLSAGIRLGRANNETARSHKEEQAGDPVCPVGGYYAQLLCEPGGYYYDPQFLASATNWSDASARNREEHTIVDFAVGKDVGVGVIGEGRSSLGLGLRYAQFESITNATMDGIPDWYLPEGWLKYDATHNHYRASLMASRQFDGVGPTLSWEAAKRLFGNDEAGHVDIDWSVTGGVLLGKQKTAITGFEEASYFSGKYTTAPSERPPLTRTTVDIAPRSKSVSVPLLDLSLGLSYEIQRIKVGAGYRWERYFDVLDVGYTEHKDADRTIDGPYFKVSVGFGG